MSELQYVEVGIQGVIITAYIDFKVENSFITSALLDSLKYQKNEIKYGEALIPIDGAYRITGGFLKECKFTLHDVTMKHPMYIVLEGEKYIVIGKDWLKEHQARIIRKGTEEYLKISYEKGEKSKSLRIPLYNMMEHLLIDKNLEVFTTESTYFNSPKETNTLTEEIDMLINLSEDVPTEIVSQKTRISKDVLKLDDKWFQQMCNNSEESTYDILADSIDEYPNMPDELSQEIDGQKEISIFDEYEHIDSASSITSFQENDAQERKKKVEELEELDVVNFQQKVNQWMQQVQKIIGPQSSIDKTICSSALSQTTKSSHREKEAYLINSSPNSQKRLSKKTREKVVKYKNQTGELQKKRKMKEGKCFICEEKGHRMNECILKKEFRRCEQYCHQYQLNIWDRWKRIRSRNC